LADFVNKRLAAQPPQRGTPQPFGQNYEKVLQEITNRPAG
jgi:hypothetical protein